MTYTYYNQYPNQNYSSGYWGSCYQTVAPSYGYSYRYPCFYQNQTQYQNYNYNYNSYTPNNSYQYQNNYTTPYYMHSQMYRW